MDAAPLTGEDLSADAAAEATDYAELLGTWRDFFDLEQMEADAEATGDDVLELIRAQLRSAALIPDEVVDRVVRSFEGSAISGRVTAHAITTGPAGVHRGRGQG